MSKKEPEQLHEKTPLWFRDWHDKAFWHFQYDVNQRLVWLERWQWIIISAIIAGAVAILLFG